MKSFQTPNSGHSRKGSVKVQRQPLSVISNNQYQELIPVQCATYLQQKVNGLEVRVKNLNSQHSDIRSTTANKLSDAPLSPCIPTKTKKVFLSTNKQPTPQVDSQSYYETIINKRLENIIKVEQQPSPHIQKWPSNHNHNHTDHSSKENHNVCRDRVFNFDLIKDKYQSTSTHKRIDSDQHQSQGRLHQNTLVRLQYLTKKLRKFKMIKDQNQDECAPSLAKIKCFCQDYYQECFDFYRCTDLIALKYFIYLLLQDLNTSNCSVAFKNADCQQYYQTQIHQLQEQLDFKRNDQITFQTQLKIQKMVGDTQSILQDIINGLQSKQHQHSLIQQVETLNSQMKQIKDNILDTSTQDRITKQTGNSYLEDRTNTQYSTKSKSKSPFGKQQQYRYNNDADCDQSRECDINANLIKKQLDEQTNINRQLMEKIFKLQADCRNAQHNQNNNDSNRKVINQQEEIKIHLNNINKLEYDKGKLQTELVEQQSIYNQLNVRISEISSNLDQVVQANEEFKEENDDLKTQLSRIKSQEQKYYDLLSEHQTLFEQHSNLQRQFQPTAQIQQQLEADNTVLQNEIVRLQEIVEQLYSNKDDEDNIIQLSNQLNDQQKIISIVTEEAQFLGQIALFAADILMRHSSDDIPTTLLMLQRDLSAKKPLLLQKMKILSQFSSNLKHQQQSEQAQSSHIINQDDIDLLENLQSEPSFQDLMNTNTHTNSIRNPKHESSNQQDSTNCSIINTQNDLMTMLIVQCHTIEKMVEF